MSLSKAIEHDDGSVTFERDAALWVRNFFEQAYALPRQCRAIVRAEKAHATNARNAAAARCSVGIDVARDKAFSDGSSTGIGPGSVMIIVAISVALAFAGGALTMQVAR